MSKVSVKRRQFLIKIKRKRKKKIKRLKEKYGISKTKGEKEKIIEKIQKISPHYPAREILKLKKEK